MHDGGAPVVLQPLETIDCSAQIALPNQACRAVIRVFPPLGRQGLPTASDFDLDLIDGRTHWQGTLNFVLPASVTSRLAATGHLTLHLSANPVDATETVPGDNQFTLEHRVIAVVNPLRIRLARVQYKSSIPAPPPLTARLTLNNALRVLPYSEVKVVSDDEYRWDGRRIRIRLGPISFYKFSQCESLWIRLFQKFGLTENAVLVALTPRGLTLQGCVGLGGGVPGAGGIALSQTPDNDEDRERLAVLAQELYHALFQRSHVSTDHGEKHGCPLHGSEIATLISILTRGRFDCAKRSPYPHGALGAYPATGATINGARGGMAVDILPFGTTWKLMLFDPCPTGSIRFNPLIALGRRWDTITKKYRCLLDDSFVAHDFMSYGGHRWSSRAQFFGGPRLSLVTPTS
jgi:hypothetical protein